MTGIEGETAILGLIGISLGHLGLMAMDRRRAHLAGRPGRITPGGPKGDPPGGTAGEVVPVTMLRDPGTGQFVGKTAGAA